MIAVDTNVIVRLLTRDNEAQYKAAHKLFASETLYIPDTVILEVEWALRYAYDFKPAVICTALRNLFGLNNVHLNNAQLIAQVIDWHLGGLDFADAFHLALSQQQEKLKTFDESFIKGGKKLSHCLVEKP